MKILVMTDFVKNNGKFSILHVNTLNNYFH